MQERMQQMQERWEAEQRLWLKGAASGVVPLGVCLRGCMLHSSGIYCAIYHAGWVVHCVKP